MKKSFIVGGEEMIFFLIACIVVILDQVSKWIVVQNMSLGQSIPVIEGLLYWTSHRNAGAAFGILQNQRWFFIIITIVILIGVIYYLYQMKEKKSLLPWALALILGGAFGNFIDRVLFGEVVDFIDVKISIGSFYWNFPIFNIADSALVIGVSLFIIDVIIDSIHEKKQKSSAES